jgi:wyosine [tRNA(Phe)-imidazoG37] synthetase (radical SAM superfamily)
VTGSGSRIWFGPVPSRRLGNSLGINNIPAKACNYSCVYCQVGRTTRRRRDRRRFFDPEHILRDVRIGLAETRKTDQRIDFATFVADGEPTLDINLGKAITLIKTLHIPVAVITNGSLLWREDVRKDLALADWVSLKVDALHEAVWRRVNRPHRGMSLPRILDGLRMFADMFAGTLVTETLLVRGLNDDEAHMRDVAGFLQTLRPDKAYLSIPTRPPAERIVRRPDEAALNRACQILAEKIGDVEWLIGYEGDAFGHTDDVEKDILGITAVHPMRETAVGDLLKRSGTSWDVMDRLIARGDIVKTEYAGNVFYVRRITESAR